MAQARIIDQETDLQLETGDYILVDSLDEGTRKFDLGGHIESTGEAISELSNKIGDTTMGTTATTITGAIAEHEGDISSLSSSIDAQAQDISSLSSSINDITYFSCTDAGSYYDITRQNCYAIGKRVFISLELSVTTANPPTAADVAIIPSGYRPASNLNNKGFVLKENGGYVRNLRPALASISTSGAVRQSLSSAFTTSDIVVIWAEYMMA